jgi:hypothetical protein
VIEGIVGAKLDNPFLLWRWLGEGWMVVLFEAPLRRSAPAW